MKPGTPWFPYVRPRPDAVLRLFCLPHSGAAASTYRGWQEQLPGVEVWSVQLPGRETRLREAPFTDAQTVTRSVADAMAPFLDRPYALFGHSMGALLGYLLTRELEARGAPQLPERLLASGTGSPSLPRPPEMTGVTKLPDAEFLEAVSGLDGTPAEVLQEPELLAMLLPILRADFSVVDSYEHSPGMKLTTPITVFAGDADAGCSERALAAWGELTETLEGVHVFSGGHFYLLGDARPPFFAALRTSLGV